MKSWITLVMLSLAWAMIYGNNAVAGDIKHKAPVQFRLKFTYVIDGDTVVVNGEHIRLLTIDTPEIHGKCLSEKTMAFQAKGFVQGVLTTNKVRIVRKGTGKYGRTLADLWIGNKTLSEMLLDFGLARKYDGGRKPWCR